MTDVRDRAASRPDDAEDRPVPLFAGALTTGLWAAVVGIAPLAAVVLVVWVAAASGGTGATDAARFALGGWLLAHGVPLTVDGTTVGLAPLGLGVIAFWQLVRAGTNTARAVGVASLTLAARVVAAITAVYATTGGIVALLTRSEYLDVSLPRAVAATAAVAACGAGVGVLRIPEVRGAVTGRLGDRVVDVLRGGALAAAGVFAAGALVAGVRVVLSADHAAELVRALEAGPVGTVGLLVLCVLYAPTAVVWGASYLIGPGFAVGVGTSVTAGAVELGPLPGMPLFAGLPVEPASGAVLVLLALPLVAGALAGVRVSRTGTGHWREVLVTAALTGPAAGLLVGLAALFATGSLGGDRLAELGPSPWLVALACAAVVAAGAVLGAAAHRGLRRFSRFPQPARSR